jgi:hypothetical protein
LVLNIIEDQNIDAEELQRLHKLVRRSGGGEP